MEELRTPESTGLHGSPEMGRGEEEGMESGGRWGLPVRMPEGCVPVPHAPGLAGTEPEDMPGIHSIHSLIHSFNRHFLCPYDV